MGRKGFPSAFVVALSLLGLVNAALTPVRAAGAQSLGGITLNEVRPRIVTPNGDSRNDIIFFDFDTSLAGLPLDTSVVDIHGAKIADLTLDATDDSLLTWNGKDTGGRDVPAGIYIYSIKIGSRLATGTVVVAR